MIASASAMPLYEPARSRASLASPVRSPKVTDGARNDPRVGLAHRHHAEQVRLPPIGLLSDTVHGGQPETGDYARDLSRLPLWLLVFAPAVAFGTMAWWILRDARSTPASAAFVSTPEFVLWLLILCGQASFWALAFGYVVGTVIRRAKDLRATRLLTAGRVLPLVGALLVLVILPALVVSSPAGTPLSHIPAKGEFPLADNEAKITPIVVVGLAIGFLAIVGMWAATIALNRLQPSGRPSAALLGRFLALRREVGALLSVAGTLVGLATLSSGALRLAVLAANKEPYFAGGPGRELEFASGYVLAYGLFFTGLLAIAFAPSFLAMRAAGDRLRDAAHPLVAPNHPKFAEVVAERNGLDAVLQTNLSAGATFKAGAAILTPLAGSLVALVLPT